MNEDTFGEGPHLDPTACPTYYDGCNCHIAVYDMIYLHLNLEDQVREGSD